LMPLAKKNQVIIDSGNHYIGALKGNQSGLLEVQVILSHLRGSKISAKGMVGLKTYIKHCRTRDGIREWPGLKTLFE